MSSKICDCRFIHQTTRRDRWLAYRRSSDTGTKTQTVPCEQHLCNLIGKALYWPVAKMNKPPRFVTKPTIKHTGNKLTISCEVEGNPKPDLQWFKGAEPVSCYILIIILRDCTFFTGWTNTMYHEFQYACKSLSTGCHMLICLSQEPF